MDQFIARANIDHYLKLLDDGAPGRDITIVQKLLLEEETKLARTQEQLDFIEDRVINLRRHHDRMSNWRDGFKDGSADRTKADAIVEKTRATLYLMEAYWGQMRYRVKGR